MREGGREGGRNGKREHSCPSLPTKSTVLHRNVLHGT